ncbi:MAG: phosphopantetheine-binding protein [Bacteroidales bacterium]
MTDLEIIKKINIVLADEFEVDASIITPNAQLMSTLDLDSLDLVDIVVLVEQNFNVTLVGSDFINIKTFQDFYDLIIVKTRGIKKIDGEY